MKYNEILEFAKKQGYEDIKFLKVWKGYDCYEPIFSEGISYTGLPLVILVKDEKIRMSTSDESLEI